MLDNSNMETPSSVKSYANHEPKIAKLPSWAQGLIREFMRDLETITLKNDQLQDQCRSYEARLEIGDGITFEIGPYRYPAHGHRPWFTKQDHMEVHFGGDAACSISVQAMMDGEVRITAQRGGLVLLPSASNCITLSTEGAIEKRRIEGLRGWEEAIIKKSRELDARKKAADDAR